MPIPHRIRHVVAVATALSCLSAAADLPRPAVFLPISKSVVRVVAAKEGGGVSVGSGVTVAPSVVATSCHIIRDAGEIRISGSGGSWEVDAEQGDIYRDVCLLRAPSWTGAPVDLAPPDSTPQMGASVVALGFSGGAPIKPNFGHIRALHPFHDGHIIEADAVFNSGSSGGGLFAADGKLIGLLTFRLRNSTDSFYSVPVDWVRQRLAAEGDWVQVRPLPKGSTPFWEREAADLPAFMRAADLAISAPGA